ncbi:UPF0280 family protein [Candidatus Bathyarchaeota archaeon]|nr:MAG: UPF0280 family protein [Candidatus Bathyarchaeota archaeon]
MIEDLYEYSFVIKESKIHMKSNSKEAIKAAVNEIRRNRKDLIEFISDHPEFLYRLWPINITANIKVPKIVKLMVESSKIANVGPMASVAGVLADIGLEAMLREKANVAIVENGGEIAAFTDRPIIISIFSNNPNLQNKIGFLLESKDCPIGVATSSSKTVHALSFGNADSVTVVAINASVADAAATAICNSVVGKDAERAIQRGLERAKSIEGVRGVLIVFGDKSGIWGKLPKIVKIS